MAPPLGTPPGDESRRRSPRSAALIAEVLGALEGRLRDSEATTGAPDGPTLSPEIEDLIASALEELGPLTGGRQSGVAPVLGRGVVSSLLRQRRQQLAGPGTSEAEPALDIKR